MKETIYIMSYGAHLSKKEEKIIVKIKEEKRKFSIRKINKIVFIGFGKGLSIDAVWLATKFGVPIFFAYSNGMPYATVLPVITTGTVKTRRAQYEAPKNRLGVELVKGIIKGKILNQYTLLKYYWKSRKRTKPQKAEKIGENANKIKTIANTIEKIEAQKIDTEFREKIMKIEADAAEIYWEAIKQIIPERYDFQKRIKPNAKDPTNVLLNFGYALLFMETLKEIVYSGLDPYAGLLHTDRPGRESLVLDIMEIFRQWSVDRIVIKILTTKKPDPEEIIDNQGKLTREAIKTICTQFEENMETQILTMDGKKKTLRNHIKSQISLIKRHLTNTEKYRPTIFVW